MRKRIAMLTEDLYEDIEFWYPYYRLKEEGHEVVVIGSGKKEVFTGKYGMPNKVDMAIGKADPKEFDGVFVPGGYAPDKMRLHPQMAEFVRRVWDGGKWVFSLCHGPWVLISAGIASGRRMTCWPTLKDDVMNAGARYLDQEVVVDGKMITSRCPNDLPTMMKEVTRALSLPEEKEKELVRAAVGSR